MTSKRNRTEGMLYALGIGMLGLSGWLTFVSRSFELHVQFLQRPVIPVVAVLLVASIFCLLACWLSSRLEKHSQKRMMLWIVGVGIVSRIVLLGSTPILEIDLYRYLWDGNVTASIGDPYKYAPIEFTHDSQQTGFTRSKAEMFSRATFSPARDESMQQALAILTQHFGQFTSPYPPVSQAVFALSHCCCPEGSSLNTRVVVLKTFLVLFDIAVGIVLILILRKLKLPETMSIVWFWSPLVLKEFANGGHLDSIAIFLCSVFVLYTVKQLAEPERGMRNAVAAGVFLALGVGAKVFPVVLVPLWAVVALQRLGLKAIVPGLVSLVLVVAVNLPMLLRISEYRSSPEGNLPKPGVLAFAESWEMNDMIFMVIVENLKPAPPSNALTDGAGESPFPENTGENVAPSTDVNDTNDWAYGFHLERDWFVVVPESWRADMTFETAFGSTRWITMTIFLAIIAWLIWRWCKTAENEQPKFFVECVFLTLAWFWFLSPTQNPWYWCWVLPFVPFARSRVWYLVAAVTLLYYLRFHFDYHGYDITAFDFVVPFIEFGTVLGLLVLDNVRERALSKRVAM